MNVNNEEKRALDDFKRQRVNELKTLLQMRGLKVTGTKEERVALAYGAEQCSFPLKVTTKQEEIAKAKQYKNLLHIRGEQLPDPLRDLAENTWTNEVSGKKMWPPIFSVQIAQFLLTTNQKDLGKRLLSDYKEGKAYSYFDSKWLKEVFYHRVSSTSDVCFLKSEYTPSQHIKNIPHKIWVCANKKNGTIESAYCTCFAGYDCIFFKYHI